MAKWYKYAYPYNLRLIKERTAYHSIHHIRPLLPDALDHSWYVHHILSLNLLQDMIDGDESSSSTNSITGGNVHA